MTNQPLNILSIGAGAIGTYIGGSLALEGYKVVFLERPEIAKQLRQNAVQLELVTGLHTIDNPLIAESIEDALDMGPYDAALFALKSFDTKNALNAFSKYADRLPPFLCLQNGVDNEREIAEALGADKVIYGTVTSAIGRRGPGNIVLERLRGMGVAGGHPLSERLTAALDHAGLNAVLYPRPEDMKWSKMLTNLLANASAAILDMTPGEVFAAPALYRLEIQQLRETLAVMGAQNIGLTNLPGTPVKALGFAARYLPAAMSQPLLKKAVGKGRGNKMPSFHIDLYGGRGKSEVDFLNGAVSRAGKLLGIPTPINDLFNVTLQKITSGEIPLEEFRRQPEKLTAAAKSFTA